MTYKAPAPPVVTVKVKWVVGKGYVEATEADLLAAAGFTVYDYSTSGKDAA